jgi:hypothetical protein
LIREIYIQLPLGGFSPVRYKQGVTKRCRLSLLTNSTLVIQVYMRREGGSFGVSANEYSCANHVTWSPNELWRSTSIFNLWLQVSNFRGLVTSCTSILATGRCCWAPAVSSRICRRPPGRPTPPDSWAASCSPVVRPTIPATQPTISR